MEHGHGHDADFEIQKRAMKTMADPRLSKHEKRAIRNENRFPWIACVLLIGFCLSVFIWMFLLR